MHREDATKYTTRIDTDQHTAGEKVSVFLTTARLVWYVQALYSKLALTDSGR